MVLMVDSSDHITGIAGLTLAITASKNGAAFSSISPTVTDRGDGWYNIALTSAHTDTLGDLALHIVETGSPLAGADPTDVVDEVVAALPGEAVEVEANVVAINGVAIPDSSPPGNVAEAFGTMFNVASPVLTAASVNQTGDSYARLGAPASSSIAADIADVATGVGDIPTANENADALLKRDWTAVTGEAARSLLNAVRFLRNKWSVSAGTLTVFKENGSTQAWQANVDSDSGADPITGNTPT
jgi:hypothetical protein